MSPSITKLQRWLDLIAFLVGRRLPVSVDEIMEAIPAYAGKYAEGTETERASVRRTFERDKDELRRASIPIETTEYHINYGAEKVEGYALKRRDFYLPYLKLVTSEGDPGASARRPYALPEVQLTESEADLAIGALREVSNLPGFPLVREARSAMRKLAFDLDLDALQDDDSIIYVDRADADDLLALAADPAGREQARRPGELVAGAVERESLDPAHRRDQREDLPEAGDHADHKDQQNEDFQPGRG